jgi:hypothetical protein
MVATDGAAEMCPTRTGGGGVRDNPTQWWSYYIDPGVGAELLSVAIGFDHRYVFAGAFDGGARMFDNSGRGIPLWHLRVDDGVFLTAAAETSDIFFGAVGDYGSGAPVEHQAVYRFAADSPVPIWTYEPEAGTLSIGSAGFVEGSSPITCTPSGDLLAVIGSQGDKMVVLLFDSNQAEPFGAFVTDQPADARYRTSLQLTPDGKTLFYYNGRTLGRVDVTSLRLEFRVDFAAWSVGLSPNGALLVRAHPQLVEALRWDGEDYELIWRHSFDDRIRYALPGPVAVAGDDDTVAVAWNDANYRQVTLTTFRGSCALRPAWSYSSPPGSGTWLDRSSAVRVSVDGERIALGTWGTEDNAHPELLLFHGENLAQASFGLDVAGSVSVLDMTADGRFVALGGRAEHVNNSSSGGAAYFVGPDER